MSYLSVFVQHLAEAEIVARVPAAAFEPAPKVDSAVLRLRRRAKPLIAADRRDAFHRLVQAGFRQRRKQIHNALARELPIDRHELDTAFAACAIAPDRRAQTLTVAEWACLAEALASALDRPARGGVARLADE
jgi:16S rRNA (adenine1518-N6/adenine1519-N6)-dimethyltransferase